VSKFKLREGARMDYVPLRSFIGVVYEDGQFDLLLNRKISDLYMTKMRTTYHFEGSE